MSGVLGPFTLRRSLTVVSLVFAWCALWGTVSVANLVSGMVVAVPASSPLIGTTASGGVRIGPLARFGALVFVDLAASTVRVAREVLTPTDSTEEGIIAVDVPSSTRSHFLLLIVAVTLTPGTAVVDADPETGRLYLHLLHGDQADATAEHVRELAELACRALPVEDAGAVA